MNAARLFTLCLMLAVAACAPSTGAGSTAIAQTQTAGAIPTFSLRAGDTLTPSPVPLSAVNLEAVLLWPGDLPSGYAAAELRAERSGLTARVAPPDIFISRMISHNGQPGGRVDVLLYEDEQRVAAAFPMIWQGFSNDLDNPAAVQVGEQGMAAATFKATTTTSLTFTRCHAVVAIQLLGTSSADTALAYAKRLDSRLSAIVCGT